VAAVLEDGASTSRMMFKEASNVPDDAMQYDPAAIKIPMFLNWTPLSAFTICGIRSVREFKHTLFERYELRHAGQTKQEAKL
jgi:hypothetical protein